MEKTLKVYGRTTRGDMIRVLIAEDHLMVRAGIRALLEKAGDIHVMGEASNGQEAIEMTNSLKPDVLIMDIMMPRMNGIQAAENIREMRLPTHILLLSMYSDEGFVHQALQCGVKGYVLKSSVSDELLWAVRAVASGKTYLSSPISEIVVESAIHPHAALQEGDPLSNLSPREKEILQLIAEEHTSAEIGKMLFISEKTVEKHRTKLMEKLNVRNLAGLVRLAVKYHLVDRDA
jgi:DNA-binding NarL/FixJ family response regulator